MDEWWILLSLGFIERLTFLQSWMMMAERNGGRKRNYLTPSKFFPMNSVVLKLTDCLLLEKPRKLDTPRGNGGTLAEPRGDLIAALTAVVPATATEAEAETGSLPTADLQMLLTGDTVSQHPLLSTTTRCPLPGWSVVRLTAQSTICPRPSVIRPSLQWRPRFSPGLATNASSSVTRWLICVHFNSVLYSNYTGVSVPGATLRIWSGQCCIMHHSIYCGSK